MIPLPALFYSQPTVEVARSLLGQNLVSFMNGVETAGIIMETEAYVADDPASHAYRRQKPRNAAMFGPAAAVYVYRSYGLHTCFNVVTGPAGSAEAVLLRILLPTVGLGTMRQRRGGAIVDGKLCSGPGNLCVALKIGMELYGHRIDKLPLLIAETPVSEHRGFMVRHQIFERPRIGISHGKDLPLRFTAMPI